MIRGLLAKSLRETWAVTVVIAIAVAILEALLAYILPTYASQFVEMWAQIEFFKGVLEALVGASLGDNIGPHVLLSIAWVHPGLLAMVAAQATVFSTRLPVGEVDRGTIDVLLGLPVSRWRLYACELIMLMATGVFILCFAVIGNRIGGLFVDAEMRTALSAIMIVLINLFTLYLAVAALGWLVSSMSDRRGKAIGIVFGILIASFLLNFLAQFWKPADAVSFLSILSYYQPMSVIQDGAWPLADVAILLALGSTLWVAAGIVLARRDLCTV